MHEDPDALARFFGVERMAAEGLGPSYNVAPTDEVYAVAEHEGVRGLGALRWGLIPHWAKSRKGRPNINARAETVADRPAFRDSFRRRRCIVPASGFYEWAPESAGRQPFYITMADRSPMAFAGIWASWKDPETRRRVRSCAVITTRACEAIASIHTRMPVILPPEHWDLWLDREITAPEAVEPLLAPAPASRITRRPVSTLVNSVRNNLPENILTLETAPLIPAGG